MSLNLDWLFKELVIIQGNIESNDVAKNKRGKMALSELIDYVNILLANVKEKE